MSLKLVRPGEPQQDYPKASMFLRAGARLIDAGIAYLLYVATGPAGIVMALLYTLFADAMIQGQSPGKKMFGVKAIFLPTRSAVRHRDSVLRNAPFGLVVILAMMPDLGLKAFIGGVLVVGGIEAIRAWRDPQGHRLGDLWALTQVIDGKEPISQSEQVSRPVEEARATGRANKDAPES
jgi:uncharacterized RDD family membrane protein YckC